MIIDFIVHSEHADSRYGNYPDPEVYKRYLEHLVRVAEKSEFPILIRGLFGKKFEKMIPEEQQVDSGSYRHGGQLYDYGFVSPVDWKKFTPLIDSRRDSEMRVHGSFIGQCAEGFAVQLCMYLLRNEHWYDQWGFEESYNTWKHEKKIWDDRYARYKRIKLQHESMGDFAKSQIKYGIVLAPSSGTEIIKPSRWPLIKHIGNRRQGNITFQLIDSETVIYEV